MLRRRQAKPETSVDKVLPDQFKVNKLDKECPSIRIVSFLFYFIEILFSLISPTHSFLKGYSMLSIFDLFDKFKFVLLRYKT